VGELESELLGCLEQDLLPVVIHCQSEEGEEPRQSHVTIAGNSKKILLLLNRDAPDIRLTGYLAG
jgi:hypothetical protein